ncbi:hypothetical protein DY000_02050779 [Brassica cretica]|uniref:Uncharacterized protein n=1 Tax=Brassica cretica TaxID=69181 RepID=A0ABQ7F078_BRACR|nr:hypothetical protein DY000_02050779 [Brassica cretica]
MVEGVTNVVWHRLNLTTSASTPPEQHHRNPRSDPNTHLNGNLTELDTNRTSNLNPKDTGFLSGNAELCKPPLSVTKSRRRRS